MAVLCTVRAHAHALPAPLARRLCPRPATPPSRHAATRVQRGDDAGGPRSEPDPRWPARWRSGAGGLPVAVQQGARPPARAPASLLRLRRGASLEGTRCIVRLPRARVAPHALQHPSAPCLGPTPRFIAAPPRAVTMTDAGWLALWGSLFGLWSGLFYHRTNRFIYPFLGACWALPACRATMPAAAARRCSCCCRRCGSLLLASKQSSDLLVLLLEAADGRDGLPSSAAPLSVPSFRVTTGVLPLCRPCRCAQALCLGLLSRSLWSVVGGIPSVLGGCQVGGVEAARVCRWLPAATHALHPAGVSKWERGRRAACGG